MERPQTDTCLVITDGRAGNVRQARALAAAMGFEDAPHLALVPHAPWRWMAPRVAPGSAMAYGRAFSNALSSPPAVAIGCGRQAALATRLLRARGARVVQILDPRMPASQWDVVVAPEHDGLAGDNVVALVGSLNPVDDAWLAEAHAAFSILAPLAQPRVALLLGGESDYVPGYDAVTLTHDLHRLADALRRDGGTLLATTSRRTPGTWCDALRAQSRDIPGLRWFAPTHAGFDDAENPYPGLLAWADRIVCTADSVNMLSEACATRAPVHVLGSERVRGRLQQFHAALRARGRVSTLADFDAPTAAIEPLRETSRVAGQVLARLNLI
jgi:mitochondrial fission protein ELM1